MCELLDARPRQARLRGRPRRTSGDAAIALLAARTSTRRHRSQHAGHERARRCASASSPNRADMPVVVITAFGSLETAVARDPRGRLRLHHQAVRARGARARRSSAPSSTARCATEVRAAARSASSTDDRGRSASWSAEPGDAPDVRHAPRRASADSDATVLITGESGTGKELVARALHDAGAGAGGPFVAINCARDARGAARERAVRPREGAFTERAPAAPGLFLQANGGTLFLDEIGEMPLALQPKLLRALQERTVRPVGGDARCPSTSRLVARDQPRPRERGRGAALPRGPLLPHQRDPHRAAAAARARRRRAAARPALRRAATRRRSSKKRRRASPPPRPRSCSPTAGPATCASCRTASSARSR